jgi:hypothetical protein
VYDILYKITIFQEFTGIAHNVSAVYDVAAFSPMPAWIKALRSIVPQERDQSWQNGAEFWRGNEAKRLT